MPTTVTFYESEKQAGDRFESAFAAPVVLQRFVDRISWTTTSPFPSTDGNEVQLAAPQLGDLFGDERLHAEMMTRAMSSS